MKRFYIIVPVLLLATFGGFYWNYSRNADVIAEQKAAAAAREEMEEAAKKEAVARKAREDAEKRAAERDAAELAKEAERKAAWEADNEKIAADTDRYRQQLTENREEVERLEAELAARQDQLDKAKADAFSLRREIELRKISRRNAELEQQRLLTMVGERYETLLLTPRTPAPQP